MRANVGELKSKIHSIFGIDNENQDLSYANQRLGFDDDALSKYNIKHREKLILKHSLLPKFINFKKLLYVSPKSSEDKRDIARRVRVLKETFDSAKFFDVYDELYTDTREVYAELMRCLNYDPTVIMDSVKLYLGARNVKYLPEKNPGGSNAGLIFEYKHDNTTETFYLKANETNWGANPDARELIVYMLLQRIGVGPSKCSFIPSAALAQSRSVVYIATSKVPEFTMAKDLPNPMDETPAVELHLMAILLNLTDLNTENFGLKSNGSLCIVDFSLTKIYKDSSCASHFKEHVRRQPILANLNNCPGSRRVEIAKKSIKRWNLDSAINETEQDFLHVKTELKEEVAFLDRATGAIRDYLESIKWNLEKLTNEWGEEISQ